MSKEWFNCEIDRYWMEVRMSVDFKTSLLLFYAHKSMNFFKTGPKRPMY